MVLYLGVGVGIALTAREMQMSRDRELARDLRANEERFDAFVDAVKDYAIVQLDRAGTIMSWNSGAQLIKGFLAEEIVGQHFSRFYPEVDVVSGKDQRHLRAALAEGRFEEEGWRIRKDGSSFWASVILTAVHDLSGKHVGFTKITRELTARKQAEEQSAVLAAVFDHNPDAIILIDRGGRIVNVNSRTAELFGYPKEALLDRTVEILLPERYRDRHVPLRDGFFAAPEAQRVGTGRALFSRRADGSEFLIDVLIAPIQQRTEILGIALVRDITASWPSSSATSTCSPSAWGMIGRRKNWRRTRSPPA